MKRAIILASLVTLVGCSGSNQQAAIRDRQLDYQAAYVEPKLKVPEGLSDDRVNESLRIPGVDEPTAGLYGGSFEAPRAEAALRTLTLPTIRRYQLGDFHWLSIPEAPSAVWPELERFVADNKLLVVKASQSAGIQSVESSVFQGVNTHSGSRIIRHFAPEVGPVSLKFSLEPGLRVGTSEVRLEGRILEEFKYHLERREDEGKAVSRALSLLEVGNRMTSRRVDGMDELIIAAEIPRVFGVTVDAVRDLGAAIDGGDLEKGLLNIRYVRKATERRLATMSALNRAIATTIEDPVGSYQVQMQRSDEGLVVKVVPTGAAASIGGANELIREFRERLY
ncbi:MAG: hypothetical protein EBT74_05295 [Gammaproteobacteria bacterium]|nr:hypothetical protein [Gammaproteobacteria bacterium]